MDDIRVLPEFPLNPHGAICKIFLERGIKHLRQVAELIRNWPYGYPDSPLGSVLDCANLGYGTCTEKHAVVAACAMEMAVPVFKVVGIYPLDTRLVSGIAPILADFRVPFVPATHCFLIFREYRIDLTEGNCNGKNGPIDQYWQIHKVAPLPSQAELDALYADFIEHDFRRFMPYASELGLADWRELKHRCTEQLKLSLACHIPE